MAAIERNGAAANGCASRAAGVPSTTEMEQRVADDEAPAIDVVFALAGMGVPVEHAYGLARAVLRWLPWMEGEPRAGIHRLRTSPTGYGTALLAHRAKLALRVPRHRLDDALALAGRTLEVGGSELAVGRGAPRALQPWPTLHSAHVVAQAGDEAAFQLEVAQWLRDHGVACEFITGRRRAVRAGEREVVGYSVVLHGLSPAASLDMLYEGMGGERTLGCGIFVPHKSIAAVG